MLNIILESMKQRGLLGTRKTIAKVLLSTLRWKLLLIFKPKVVRSSYGPKFISNFPDATFRYYIKGSYGGRLSNCINSIQQPFIFIDVGANQGLYSFIAQTNPHCKAIYAFEPVAQTYLLLNKNIELNCANKIRALNYAISDGGDQRKIFVNPNHTGTASIEYNGLGGEPETISCVSSKTIDALLALEEGLELFIKIDTEGHEPVVINELRKAAFWHRVTRVFFEADDAWFDSQAVINTLVDDGFAESWRTANGVSHYDVFMTRTFL